MLPTMNECLILQYLSIFIKVILHCLSSLYINLAYIIYIRHGPIWFSSCLPTFVLIMIDIFYKITFTFFLNFLFTLSLSLSLFPFFSCSCYSFLFYCLISNPAIFFPNKFLHQFLQFFLIFVSPELSSVRDYVITHSVRSMCMCMYVVFCKIDHCIHIH